MNVVGLLWGASRVEPDQVEPMRALGALLGLASLSSSPSVAAFTTSRGDVIEFCGPDHPVPAHLFADQDVALGFAVDDVETASAELADGGIELVGSVQRLDGGVTFRHFRGPDGRIYALIEVAADPGDQA